MVMIERVMAAIGEHIHIGDIEQAARAAIEAITSDGEPCRVCGCLVYKGLTEGRKSPRIGQLHDLRVADASASPLVREGIATPCGSPPYMPRSSAFNSEAIMSAVLYEPKGVSGNTAADLREVASVWDKSAEYCDTCGETELAARDRRFAAAMREAASILEALRYDS